MLHAIVLLLLLSFSESFNKILYLTLPTHAFSLLFMLNDNWFIRVVVLFSSDVNMFSTSFK